MNKEDIKWKSEMPPFCGITQPRFKKTETSAKQRKFVGLLSAP